jgi:hypothetical protein
MIEMPEMVATHAIRAIREIHAIRAIRAIRAIHAIRAKSWYPSSSISRFSWAPLSNPASSDVNPLAYNSRRPNPGCARARLPFAGPTVERQQCTKVSIVNLKVSKPRSILGQTAQENPEPDQGSEDGGDGDKHGRAGAVVDGLFIRIHGEPSLGDSKRDAMVCKQA